MLIDDNSACFVPAANLDTEVALVSAAFNTTATIEDPEDGGYEVHGVCFIGEGPPRVQREFVVTTLAEIREFANRANANTPGSAVVDGDGNAVTLTTPAGLLFRVAYEAD